MKWFYGEIVFSNYRFMVLVDRYWLSRISKESSKKLLLTTLDYWSPINSGFIGWRYLVFTRLQNLGNTNSTWGIQSRPGTWYKRAIMRRWWEKLFFILLTLGSQLGDYIHHNVNTKTLWVFLATWHALKIVSFNALLMTLLNYVTRCR